MLINDCGLIGGKNNARADGDRAGKYRLIAMAIGRRSTGDTDGWARVAEQIAALAPDFATLVHFIRREPDLLSTYFAVEARVRPLIAGSRPTERLLVRYAGDLAAARAPSIVDLTDDERLRARLYELFLIASASEQSPIAAAIKALELRTPDGITALVFLLLRMGRASAHQLPLQMIGGWSVDRRHVFFWRYLAFTFERRLAPFADPAQTFRLILNQEEKARVVRLQMPGQFAVAERTGPQLLRHTVWRAGLPATRWFDINLTLPRLASMTTVALWTSLVRSTLNSQQAQEYLRHPSTIRLMTRRFGVDGY